MSKPHLIVRKPDLQPIKCAKSPPNDAPTTESRPTPQVGLSVSQPHLIVRKPDSLPIKCGKSPPNDAPTIESRPTGGIKCVTATLNHSQT
ncbi:hypothetical protein PCCS19_59310 [Paenibacillus sp. CCS19]|nr:hypothetical protein PCCS19_59310 [Paenibacillus cellulosilyticus]